jgi:hypothetical protein
MERSDYLWGEVHREQRRARRLMLLWGEYRATSLGG